MGGFNTQNLPSLSLCFINMHVYRQKFPDGACVSGSGNSYLIGAGKNIYSGMQHPENIKLLNIAFLVGNRVNLQCPSPLVPGRCPSAFAAPPG